MTIETIVGTIIVEAEILIEIPIAEITIMMGEIEGVAVAEEEVIVKNFREKKIKNPITKISRNFL